MPASKHITDNKPLQIAVFFELMLGFAAVILAYLFDVPIFQMIQPGVDALFQGILWTIPSLGVLVVVAHVTLAPIRRIQEFMAEYLLPLFDNLGFSDVVLISAVAGLSEELLFRGFLMTLLLRWVDPVWAIVISGALFGLLHFATLSYALIASAMGIFLGWIYHRSGNLLEPVVIHALYDLVAFLYLPRVLNVRKSTVESHDPCSSEKSGCDPDSSDSDTGGG